MNSLSGLSSSRRHLQSGNSLSGSLRGINSDLMPIPPAPLPPTSVPPHICILGGGGGGGGGLLGGGGGEMMNGDLMDDEDDDDDMHHHGDLFMNGGDHMGGDRFSSGDSV